MTRSFKAHRPKAPRGAVRPLAAGAGTRAKPEARKLEATEPAAQGTGLTKEIGGPSGPEPTRYGDWERNGICYDF